MRTSLSHSARTLKTGPRPSGQRLTIHFSIDKKVVCQAECNMTADTRFVQLPLPVLHRLRMGVVR